MNPRPVVHRIACSGGLRPRCGAPGPVRLSTSGVCVTCSACLATDAPPDREAILRQIAETAHRDRAAAEVTA